MCDGSAEIPDGGVPHALLQNLLYEKRAGIAYVTINRPQAMNALSHTALEELRSVMEDAQADPVVQGVIVTGAGEKAFVRGFGGTQRLLRLIGKGRALQLILTADTIDATEAHRNGLVNEIVDADQLIPRAETILGRMALNAPIFMPPLAAPSAACHHQGRCDPRASMR